MRVDVIYHDIMYYKTNNGRLTHDPVKVSFGKQKPDPYIQQNYIVVKSLTAYLRLIIHWELSFETRVSINFSGLRVRSCFGVK